VPATPSTTTKFRWYICTAFPTISRPRRRKSWKADCRWCWPAGWSRGD